MAETKLTKPESPMTIEAKSDAEMEPNLEPNPDSKSAVDEPESEAIEADLGTIDANVKILCEELDAWKIENRQTLSELQAQTKAFQQSIQQALAKPETPTPSVVAIAPMPEPLDSATSEGEPESEPESEPKSRASAGARKAAKTVPERPTRKTRFL